MFLSNCSCVSPRVQFISTKIRHFCGHNFIWKRNECMPLTLIFHHLLITLRVACQGTRILCTPPLPKRGGAGSEQTGVRGQAVTRGTSGARQRGRGRDLAQVQEDIDVSHVVESPSLDTATVRLHIQWEKAWEIHHMQ